MPVSVEDMLRRTERRFSVTLVRTCLLALAVCVMPSTLVVAQEIQPAGGESADTSAVVVFPAAFFARYKPNTALDIVRQVPGFVTDDGDASRGFAGAAGNLLINGQFPTAKQDRPSAILSRIPASQVIEVKLIRGQVQGIDLRGQSAVVDVLLAGDAPAAVSWEAYSLYSTASPLRAGVLLSLSDNWRGVEYNTGMELLRDGNGEYGDEYHYDSGRTLTETRDERTKETGFHSGFFLNASTLWGESVVHLNGKYSLNNGPEIHASSQLPVAGEPSNDKVKYSQHFETRELGVDAERRLTDALSRKIILLYTNRLSDVTSTQTSYDLQDSPLLFRQAHNPTDTTEAIVRLEFDWNGSPDHAFQLNVEGAYNLLDGSLFQVEDTGAGPVVVDVPGGNSRVEEARGDLRLKDTWSLDHFEIGLSLGAEVSRITQSGDAELQRDFFYLTPEASLTHVPELGRLTRVRLSREVAQLDFNDFISTTVFEDDDLALGNPNLRPDRTWVAELSHERRFGAMSVVKVTAFHHWITDVMDLLPLSPSFEVPGNIGDGRRWGVEAENTLPLDWTGLSGSRLDFKFRWQDSSVTDPVTGERRVLSAVAGFRGIPDIKFRQGNKYVFDVSFRQDFEAERVAWGWRAAEQAMRPVFKVNEAERYNEGVLFEVFVESTRWLGLKARLEGHNLFNYEEARDRTIFAGARNLSLVESYSFRERTIGRRINLVLTGNF